MSSGRRPSPPDLKGTLGTFIRSTLDQVGAMTEVARREAGRTRERIDDALLQRKRQAALAALGERVYDLYATGQLELDDLPELLPAIERVRALDVRPADDAPERSAWTASAGDDARAVTELEEVDAAAAVSGAPVSAAPAAPAADDDDAAGPADDAAGGTAPQPDGPSPRR